MFRRVRWGILLLTLALGSNAFGYVHTLNTSGLTIQWPGNPHLDLVGNPTNKTDIATAEFFKIVTNSLQRWKEASGGAIQFDYWQGNEPDVYIPNSDYN